MRFGHFQFKPSPETSKSLKGNENVFKYQRTCGSFNLTSPSFPAHTDVVWAIRYRTMALVAPARQAFESPKDPNLCGSKSLQPWMPTDLGRITYHFACSIRTHRTLELMLISSWLLATSESKVDQSKTNSLCTEPANTDSARLEAELPILKLSVTILSKRHQATNDGGVPGFGSSFCSDFRHQACHAEFMAYEL